MHSAGHTVSTCLGRSRSKCSLAKQTMPVHTAAFIRDSGVRWWVIGTVLWNYSTKLGARRISYGHVNCNQLPMSNKAGRWPGMRIAPAAASARAAAAASAGDALGSSSKSSRGGMGFSLQRKRRWQPEMLRSSTWLTQTSHRHPQNCLSTALPPSTFLGEGGAPPTRLLRTCVVL